MAIRNFWTFKNCKVAKGCVEFKWEPGMSLAQKTRSCLNLHRTIRTYTCLTPLDISTASPDPLGVKLSAFNLKYNGRTVESLYQGSKVYSDGYIAHALYDADSLTAKRMSKESHGQLVGFNYFGTEYPTEPRSVFYDFLYIKAALQNYGDTLLTAENCFTDIQSNMDMVSCQARSFCEYRLLQFQGKLNILENFEAFKAWHSENVEIDYF